MSPDGHQLSDGDSFTYVLKKKSLYFFVSVSFKDVSSWGLHVSLVSSPYHP